MILLTSLNYSKSMMVLIFLNKSCVNMVSKEVEHLRFLIVIIQNLFLAFKPYSKYER